MVGSRRALAAVTAPSATIDVPTTLETVQDLRANLAAVTGRIAAACSEAGRLPGEVRVLLATKTVTPQRILTAIDAGFSLIGENRVDEVLAKAEALSATEHQMHFIGHLQSNKISAVLPHLDCLETLDSPQLAAKLERRLAGTDRVLDVYLQVNVSGEDSKSGVMPGQAAELAAAVANCEHLNAAGLMTIGLNSPDRAAVREGYAQLRGLRDELVPGGQLSMGMSGDLETAIAEGATIVRLGRAVFGNR